MRFAVRGMDKPVIWGHVGDVMLAFYNLVHVHFFQRASTFCTAGSVFTQNGRRGVDFAELQKIINSMLKTCSANDSVCVHDIAEVRLF